MVLFHCTYVLLHATPVSLISITPAIMTEERKGRSLRGSTLTQQTFVTYIVCPLFISKTVIHFGTLPHQVCDTNSEVHAFHHSFDLFMSNWVQSHTQFLLLLETAAMLPSAVQRESHTVKVLPLRNVFRIGI